MYSKIPRCIFPEIRLRARFNDFLSGGTQAERNMKNAKRVEENGREKLDGQVINVSLNQKRIDWTASSFWNIKSIRLIAMRRSQ